MMISTLTPERAGTTTLVQQYQTQAVAGDVDIEQLSLIYYRSKGLTVEKVITNQNLYKVKDFLPRVKQVSLFYSIFTPTIHCELACEDAVDDLHDQILGEEYLYLQYKSPIYNHSESIRLLLKVYKISDVSATPNNNLRTYTVYATSPEAIDNVTVTLYRSLRTTAGERGTTISDIVPVILSTELKTQKPIDIQPTTGITDKYLANLYPLEAIDYLRQVATTASEKTGSFLFFERPTGYVFRTLEDLFNKGQKQGPSASYIYDTIINTDHNIDQYNRVITYNEASFIDNFSKIALGGFANEVNNLDLITGKYTTVTYDHNKSRTSAIYADSTSRGYHNNPSFVEAYKNYTYSKYIVSAATDGINNLADKLAYQQAYALELAQNIVQVAVRGNSKIMVGDVISLEKIKPIGTTILGNRIDEPRFDKQTAGNYLISRLRDTIMVSSRPSHLQSFELIKGQFLQERPV